MGDGGGGGSEGGEWGEEGELFVDSGVVFCTTIQCRSTSPTTTFVI